MTALYRYKKKKKLDRSLNLFISANSVFVLLILSVMCLFSPVLINFSPRLLISQEKRIIIPSTLISSSLCFNTDQILNLFLFITSFFFHNHLSFYFTCHSCCQHLFRFMLVFFYLTHIICRKYVCCALACLRNIRCISYE